MVLQCEWAQIQAIILNNDGNGFGFGISGSRNSGAVVRNIFPGGAADRDGTLQNGDHLLAVGDVRLWGMGAEQVAAILRQAGQDSIRLVVARPIDPSVPNYLVNSAIVSTKSLSDPNELDRTLQSGLFTVSAPPTNGFSFDTNICPVSSDGGGAGFNPSGYQQSGGQDYLSQGVVGSITQSEMAQMLSISSSEDSSVMGGNGHPMLHNIALPLSCGPSASAVHTMVTHSAHANNPQVTVISPTAENIAISTPDPDLISHSSSSTVCAEAVIHQGPMDRGGTSPCSPKPLVLDSNHSPPKISKNHSKDSLNQLKSSASNISNESQPASACVKNMNHHVQTGDSIEGGMPALTSSAQDYSNKENVEEGSPTVKTPDQSHSHRHHHHHHHKSSSRAKSGPNALRKKKSQSLKRSGSHEHKMEEGFSLNPQSGGARQKVTRKTSMPINVTPSSTRSLALSLEASMSSLIGRKESLVVLESHQGDLGLETEVVMVLPEKEEFKISLVKDEKGLGITVAGYICEKEDLCGIFVKSVIEGSMADKSGCITINDQIVEVDGVSLSGYSNQEAVEILKTTGECVKMTIVRYLRGLKFEELKLGISQANLTTPTVPLPPTPASEDVVNLYCPPNKPPHRGITKMTCNTNHDPLGYTSSNASSNNAASAITSSSSSMSTSISTKRRRSTCAIQVDLPEVGSLASEGKSERTRRSTRYSVPNILEGPSNNSMANATSVPPMEQPELRNGGIAFHPPARSPNSLPVDYSLLEEDRLKAKWGEIVGSVIVVAQLQKPDSNSGLGISLEGTVDVEQGREVRPHHYIRSIRPGGPVDQDGKLASGDELLEVNGKCLKGLFHEAVVSSLKNLPVKVTLVCARKCNGPSPIRGTIVNNVDLGHSEEAFESRKILSGSLQSLLAGKGPEFLVKAKSEVSLACTTSHSISLELNGVAGGLTGEKTPTVFSDNTSPTSTHRPSSASTATFPRPPSGSLHRGKSKSLEPMQCGAMWSSFVEEVILIKGSHGLGFSILDYQDPQNMTETVIVVRSLVPSGAAQQDKRILPGDRLVYVNDIRLDNANLDTAVHALKGASFGPVRLGIARPLEEVQRTSPSQEHFPVVQDNLPLGSSRHPSTSTNAEGTTQASNISDLKTDEGTNSEIDSVRHTSSISFSDASTIDDCPSNGMSRKSDLNLISTVRPLHRLEPAKNIPILPKLSKFSIVVNKNSKQFLGVHLEALAYELSGTIVRRIDPMGAVARDGRLRVGDLILYLNHESMWRVTSSQAKIILRRAEFVTAGIPIIFIPEEHLIRSNETTENSEEAQTDPQSLSECFKASHRPFRHSPSSVEEDLPLDEAEDAIVPDLTVESAAICPFPADLIESSVDPDPSPSALDDVLTDTDDEGEVFVPNQVPVIEIRESFICDILPVPSGFGSDPEESPPEDMVRVYNAPPVTSSRPQPPSSFGSGFHNGSRISPSPSPIGGMASPGFLKQTLCPNKVWGENRTVNVSRQSGAGLGVSIVGGKVDPDGSNQNNTNVSGIFIKSVLPDSPAGRTGQLFTGDRILEINGIPLETSDHTVAVNAIRSAGDPVRFVVQSLKTSGSPIPAASPISSPGRLKKHDLAQPAATLDTPSTYLTPLLEVGLPDRRHSESLLEHAVVQVPPLARRNLSQSQFQDSRRGPSSPAQADGDGPDESNPFQDETLQVWNSPTTIETTKSSFDEPTPSMSEAVSYESIKLEISAKNTLAPSDTSRRGSDTSSVSSIGDMVPPEIIQAGLTDLERQAIQQKLQAEIQAKKEQHLTVYSKNSVDRGDEDKFSNEIATHVEIPVSDDGPPPVTRHSAKMLKSEESLSSEEEDNEDYNEEKINISENFKALSGEVIDAKIKRDQKMGLGMALAGHKDRMRMGTFICGLHPSGPSAATGKFKPGDEVLKVHNTVVRGRCHLNVSAIIKKLPDDISINVVVLRSEKNREKLAIPEISHFPLFLDDVIFGSPEFGGYLARREIKLKKTTEGLGLMIIEGAHKLLGKGIFISDIQQNSLAFKAKMKVGDMILAANTESFLGITYDEAALILKQVTGTVRILVVNPTDEVAKRDEAKNGPPKPAVPKPTEDAKTANEDDKPKAEGKPKEEKKKSAATLAPSSADPTAKSPARSPAKSPGKSPGKSDPNKIDIKKDANGLGLSIIGGSDTSIGAIYVHEITKNGAAEQDGRLQVGDRLVSANAINFSSIKYQDALRAIRGGTKDKVNFIIDRSGEGDSSDLYTDLAVELLKKPGKGLGLSLVGKKDGCGVFISDMIPGGLAEINGQIYKGDQIMSANDKDLSGSGQDEAVATLKAASGSVSLKLRRLKPFAGASS